MIKTISADLIIGNYIINLIKHHIYTIDLNELSNYDKRIYERLKDKYFTNFNRNDLYLFAENYPWIIDKHDFKISQTVNDQQLYINFQSGVPTEILKVMNEEFINYVKIV